MNVGVMGHVDSGKTSLVRALSTVLSTAALDKSPQSKERGITLDLGFSALMTALPSRLSAADHSFESLQMTFVDCPGHATLIRTIIAGAAIIDVVLLVIDVCKGIQTQTAECIVIAEISCRKLVVALNKIDLLPEDERENKLIKMKLRIEKLFSQTKFGGKVSIVAVAAAKAQLSGASEGVSALVDALRECAELPSLPSSPEPFCFAIDHFFAIKGHGTVATGTVLRGSIALGATIEFPELAQERKVKSMQMFRRPVSRAVRGDRVGICVTSIDAKLLERGIACSPSSLSFASVIICIVRRVRFFRSQIRSGSKLHVTTLHSTTVATCTFFGATELSHLQQDTSYVSDFPAVEWDPLCDFEQQDVLKGTEVDEPLQWALLQFPRPFLCDPRSLLVGSKLDVDVTTKDADKCRIAFYGMCRRFCGEEEKVRLFSWRLKTGIVERLVDVRDDGLCYELIAGDLFSKGGLASFLKMKVRTESGFVGTIVSAYGSNGQFRVKFENGARDVRARSKVTLRFKRYVDDKTHSMAQGEEVDAPVVIPSPPCRESKKEKEGAGQTSDCKDIQTIQAPQIKVTSVHELAAQATEAPAVSSRRRSGVVESVKDAGLVIVQGLFSMEENIKLYIGRTCEGPDGLTGVIIGPFAKMGKCKVHFEQSKDAGQGRAIVAGMEVVLDDPES